MVETRSQMTTAIKVKVFSYMYPLSSFDRKTKLTMILFLINTIYHAKNHMVCDQLYYQDNMTGHFL